MNVSKRLGILAAGLVALALLPASGTAQSTTDEVSLPSFDAGAGLTAMPSINPFSVRKIGKVLYIRVSVTVMDFTAGSGVGLAGTAAVRCATPAAEYGLSLDPYTKTTQTLLNGMERKSAEMQDMIVSSKGWSDTTHALARELYWQLCT